MSVYNLALAFDTDSPEFARGVEVGRLWEMLKTEGAFIQPIHSENVEMVMRIAEATGRKMRVEDTTDLEWVTLVVGGEDV